MGGGGETGIPSGLSFKQLEVRGEELMGPVNQEIKSCFSLRLVCR